MGYIRNHAIIVNSFSERLVKEAHEKAVGLFSDVMVTEIKQTPVNDDYSFAILPDGSKEGWDESNEHDIYRKNFELWVKRQIYEDGSSALKVIEVWFDEEGKSEIVWSI